MLTKPVNGKGPQWGRNCYFSENATIVGDVSLGDDCSVWFFVQMSMVYASVIG